MTPFGAQRRRLRRAFALLALLQIGSAALVYERMQASRHDATRINVAGTNRYLSQQTAMQRLAGADAAQRRAAMAQMDRQLQDLRGLHEDGPLTVTDPAASRHFREAEIQWSRMRALLDDPATTPAQVTRAAAATLAAMDVAVKALEQVAIQRNQDEANSLWFSAGLSLAVLAMCYWLLMRPVTQRLSQLGEQLEATSSSLGAVSDSLLAEALESAQAAEIARSEVIRAETSLQALRRDAEETLAHAQAATEQNQVGRALVSEGGEAVLRMGQAMDEIETSSVKIGALLRTADQVAFQTHILALNAAVEAARAGDTGLGFGVVANGVRGLAQRSTTAARDTEELVSASRTGAQFGSETAEALHRKFSEVEEHSARISARFLQVEKAAVRQDQAADTTLQGLRTLTASVETHATHSSTVASAVEELREHVAGLMEIVDALMELSNDDTSKKKGATSRSRPD